MTTGSNYNRFFQPFKVAVDKYWYREEYLLASKIGIGGPHLSEVLSGKKRLSANKWDKALEVAQERSGESMNYIPEDISKLIDLAHGYKELALGFQKEIQKLGDKIDKLAEETEKLTGKVDLLKKQCILTQGGLSKLEKVARKEGK